ncbi:hypothetical protein VPH35_025543 [Triticum aestivum]
MHAAFMEDQVGLDSFPLDHGFPEDYNLEEEDQMHIDGEPLFEDELANQAAGVKPKSKSKRTKVYMPSEDKLLCECWRDIGKDPKAFKVQHDGKSFNLYHCWMIINGEEKFKAQYAALMVHGEGNR